MEMNVEHEVYDETSNNWSHPNNKMFQENLEAIPGKNSSHSL
jgi:hypothetical protein